ncbi:protein mono-ADP-ribosyltransferase PARP12 [Anas platyrhynchos]|uniref:protein mono-ADP-ribosyltransferase PARP12 n=1 Tax=Anas platyrhynchos TaxID=8839 RepID=UPI0018D8C6FE|nr:protein mono-ADP-ribosyltransferase PARP12 isoform X1 [Anas platyrhynchos]XP_027303986.2 protein mono-ADP-ribosyltransferase PARP12 isoform X1 [Anas platyrhynchos]XP_027304039.2 protein mono-ADP-ribosyltransferase PARP12 isoform X1 [Anas platyrhynchos]XP_027304096.2 protein mono-ADP-ribosyltransferase PARP12 isoform X1 [Anas platyrhynchos]XP_027304337.2 protein mono-ADP-ribosyltransferase PARP12 isoform X1 [Anas platyrhynchos]XP_038026741.1 protein mono-ADP-ribosyltransferase PARP12 isoform
MENIWYWLDDFEWIEYGTEHPYHSSASVNSADLEQAFLADPKGTLLFSAGSQIYELNFKDMVQRNLVSETRRKVVRLPKALSPPFGHNMSQDTNLSFSSCPPEWDQSAVPDIGYKLVELSSSSSEYVKIKRLFEKTMKHYNICRLQRVQNPSLWQVFQWQKEQMKKLNKSKCVDERLLFHGTNPSLLPAICEQNFDWRICGVNGTAYGKGSYFARDARYAHDYSSSKSGRYSMFVAQVLVGEFVQGQSEYLRPPPRPSSPNRLYDSCVDDPEDPSIFVIFEKYQIYPAYILEYCIESSCVIL